MLRIVISGDHPLIRTALSVLISTTANLSVVGECGNDADALAGVASGMRPDVVVMDLDLDAGCVADRQRLARLFRAAPDCPMLIVTASEDISAISLALQHGVLGVVTKTRPAEVLMRAIHAIAAGETWIERSVVATIFQPGPRRDIECKVETVREKLTRRERQVVELVSLGLQSKKIAERLFIAETTVRHHLTSIYDKLSVTNRLELMRYTYNGPSPEPAHLCLSVIP